MVETKELMRLWLKGYSDRAITRLARADRKTVKRYLDAARTAGVRRDGGEEQLNDEVLGTIAETLRPGRRGGRGPVWNLLVNQRTAVEKLLDDDVNLTKIHTLLTRQGVLVPYRTLHRFCVAEFGFGKQRLTVRVMDGEPGGELQVDFGRMGLLEDVTTGRRRVCWALIFTACYSRHMFVWLTFRQTVEDVIEGFEQAWGSFGGVFKVVIPDNLKAVVDVADGVEPRFNTAFQEYAQSRGFVIDPARVASPTDKPRVERVVPYVRGAGFRGEKFNGLEDAQIHMVNWCLKDAGERIHGTTQRRPVEVFRLEELPLLLEAPASVYDLPIYATPKVHRDRHVEVAKALYSIPESENLVGLYIQARVDRQLARFYYKGRPVKVHPRQPPGGRSTDPADLPDEKRTYAMRDLEYLRQVAAGHGEMVGIYAARLLESPLPWTKMRQVYRLLGLVRRYGPERVEQACSRALEAEVLSVTTLSRMLERALEAAGEKPPPTASGGKVIQLRFARSSDEFAVTARRTDRD
ncbi:MAG: IS21 family transposase [Candidatus Dormibacteria bacterium]